MKITDNQDLDITHLLAPDVEHPATKPAELKNAVVAAASPQLDTSPASAPLEADPTHALLTAHHAAQDQVNCAAAHPGNTAPAPDKQSLAGAAEAPYITTPGEVALHDALSMISQHVEKLYRLLAHMHERVKRLEDESRSSPAGQNLPGVGEDGDDATTP